MAAICEKQKNHSHFYVTGGRLLFLLFLLAVISGCAKTAPDRPLLDGTGTPTQAVVAPEGTASRGAPISVVADQSHLTSYPGGNMSLSVVTSPFTVCQIVVSYGQSTPSKALGLVPRTTDAQGNASWNWQVALNIHTGTWPLKIVATASNGAVSTTTINIIVTLPPISLLNSQSNLIGYPKGNLLLTIATAPYVSCELLLNYGPANTVKTLRTSANVKGVAAWNWRIVSSATAGVWPLTVTVILPDGETTSIRVNVTIL
jgi:hypothetical protein